MLPVLEVGGQLHGAGLQVNRRKDVQRDVAAGQLRTRDADRATGIWVLARYPLTLCPSG